MQELVLRLRKQLFEQGLDAGAHTLCWHLAHHHQTTLSAATGWRILTRHGHITPEPKKRPKSSYTRFEAEFPNQMWQTDFTHYLDRSAPKGVEYRQHDVSCRLTEGPGHVDRTASDASGRRWGGGSGDQRAL